MFKNREKFWAFMFLITAIFGLAVISVFLGTSLTRSAELNEAAQAILQAKLRILELIGVGLIGIAGAAGQAIFRTSENADAMNEILKSSIEGLKRSGPINDNQSVPKDAKDAANQVADAADDAANRITERNAS